ncbi:MAG: ATP-binding protein [Chloroflexota bacterium]
MPVQGFEKLGVFYLGRAYDLKAAKAKEDLILYDAKDLVTHAVCVGMTGSGKTGLCVSLLEEAAIDGIPSIALDPKGDLTNLMLTFPELRPEDFLPWVNPDEARTKGISVEEYAAKQADTWKNGLASWGEDGERIRRFKDAADFAIYTPGSNAGIPLSIMKSFAAPPASIVDDSELFAERINTTATSLLTLMGVDADPMRSREHILLSTILGEAWRQGADLDLAALIGQIQNPPVTRIGVMDIESFYPSGERFKLAMQLNNLLAAPGFSAWLEGEPLDIDRLLYTAEGKPRMSIISIAHLGDAERMFFVSLLLNQLLGWMRTQSGTTSLRSLFYMDEIFGYFPPVANPPSKTPLLTLLKQARAFGLGIVLATQNPVDLDYKGLSNTGTWFIGRLQTERDKARVLEGLEGAAATASAKFDKQEMERILAGLGNRIFLLQNVHEDAPEVFNTRWALSYLRGPLTRDQIKVLMAPKKAAWVGTNAQRSAPASAGRATAQQPAGADVPVADLAAAKPVLPPDVPEFFLPARGASGKGGLTYDPMIIGTAEVRFVDTRLDVDESRNVSLLVPFGEGANPVAWDQAEAVDYSSADLEPKAAGNATYGDLPGIATRARNYTVWSKDLAGWLQRSEKLELLRSARTGLISKPGEGEREFRIRMQTAAREKRDEATDKLRQKYGPRMASLQERIRRAEQAVAREQEQARQAQMQTAVSLGATLLGAFLGRKSVSGNIGRASTAARGIGRSLGQSGDVGRAQETMGALRSQLDDLESEFRSEADALEAALDPASEELEPIAVRPKKADIVVDTVALVWVPQ